MSLWKSRLAHNQFRWLCNYGQLQQQRCLADRSSHFRPYANLSVKDIDEHQPSSGHRPIFKLVVGLTRISRYYMASIRLHRWTMERFDSKPKEAVYPFLAHTTICRKVLGNKCYQDVVLLKVTMYTVGLCKQFRSLRILVNREGLLLGNNPLS